MHSFHYRVWDNEIEEAKANYIPLAVQLTQQRRAAAHTLEHKMVESLGHMSMDRCRFMVSIESATIGESGQALKSEVRAPKQPQPEKPSTPTFFFAAHGSDRVEFLFSAKFGRKSSLIRAGRFGRGTITSDADVDQHYYGLRKRK